MKQSSQYQLIMGNLQLCVYARAYDIFDGNPEYKVNFPLPLNA